MTSFLSNLFDSMDKAKEPKQTPKDKLLDFEKMIRDDAKANGIQPRTHLENLCAQNETFAQSKVVQMMLGEYQARQLKNPKTEVLVVKDGKVITIDKKDLAKYKANGYELAEAHGGKHTTTGRSMTKGEEGEKERLVKGMKKNKADFKKRYGKDADAVMYATATKNAMEDDDGNPYRHNGGEDQVALVNSVLWRMKDIYLTYKETGEVHEDDLFGFGEEEQWVDGIEESRGMIYQSYDKFLQYVNDAVNKAGEFKGQSDSLEVDLDLNIMKKLFDDFKTAASKKLKGQGIKEGQVMSFKRKTAMEGALNLDRDTMSDSIGDMVENYVKRAPIEEINKILQFIKANKTVSQSKDSDRVIMTTEDGHTDTDSMQAKTAQIAKDAIELYKMFQNNPGDENIMTWITNKLAVAADKISSVKDYLQNPTQDGVSEASTGIAYGAAGILAKHPEAYADLKQGGDIMDHDELYQELFAYYSDTDDMPYGVQKARDGDPYEWIMNALDDADLLENANTLNRLKDEVEDFMGQINNTEMGNLNPTRLADELTEILNGTYDPGTDPVNDPEANDEDHIREQVGNAIELLEKGQIMPAMQMLNKAIGDDGHGVDFPNEDELTLTDDADFHETFGVLGYPTEEMWEAEYQGRKVKLNKPTRGDVKKFKVYVKDPKTGNVKKVNFGHGGTSAKRPTMRIRKSNPAARRSFRARHNCDNPGPKTKARYWSCRKW